MSLTFRREVLPPSSRSKSKLNKKPGGRKSQADPRLPPGFLFNLENEDTAHLQYTRERLPDYTAFHPRNEYSPYIPLRECQMEQNLVAVYSSTAYCFFCLHFLLFTVSIIYRYYILPLLHGTVPVVYIYYIYLTAPALYGS
jgi:hypothetical protein